MICVERVRHKDRLDSLFERVRDLPDDPEIQSHWARYLCILVSGLIEMSVKSILADYARNKASPQVTNYVESRLKSFRNPKMQNISDLLRAFSPTWADGLDLVADGQMKDSVDSIVNNRNAIAHGGTSGLTFGSIKQYYVDAIAVLKEIERLVGN